MFTSVMQRVRWYEPLSPWPSRVSVGFGLAVLYAFALSLQFLAQPFVWRNFPLAEIAEGWLFVFRDRLIVAAAISLAILLLNTLRGPRLWLRALLIAAGVLAGAITGEWLVRILDGETDPSGLLALHAARWSVIALAMAAAFYLWRFTSDSNQRLREESLRRASMERQSVNTRLSALKSQIEPHFLFNTLATLRRLRHVEPDVGSRMLANFIDYLRRILPMLDRTEVPLGEELELMRVYLAIIQVRMAGRLKVSIDVPEILRSIQVPPLAIATLVENAVKHGVTPSTENTEIKITAMNRNGYAVICVVDTGVGLDPNGEGGVGIGLSNVRSRLNTMYGARASLRVEGNEPRGVKATVRLPRNCG